MALLDWLQRKGTIGSVVRWAFKHYQTQKKLHPEWSNSEILQYMFEVRYISMPIRSERAQSKLARRYHDPKFGSIMELCAAIFDVEIELDPLDYETHTRAMNNAEIVLENLNKKWHTDFS